MALEWKDKVDGEDWVLAEDINAIAKAVRDVENGKLDKWTGQGGNFRLYGVDSNGQTQKMYNTSTANFNGFVARWGGATGGTTDVGGYLITADPLNPYHCTNKNYVDKADNALAKRLDLLELAAEGNIFAFVEDDSAAYEKAVPSSALSFATLDKVGGAMAWPESLLVAAPVTAIKNHGKNLFNETAIKVGGTEGVVTGEKYGVVENGYLKAKYGRYGNSILWYPFGMYLKSGTYTISADVYIGNSTPNLKFDMGVKMEGVGGTVKSLTLSIYDIWERASVTVTVKTEGTYYFLGVGHGSAENYTNCDVRFKNIQVEKADTATAFAPYREPITYEIPQAVRNLAGYGLGIDKNINNYIDFERKLFVRMCTQRMWQEGDDENTEILTDAVISVYPLDVVETVDISASLTFDGEIEVEANGAIVAVNEYEAAIPSTITYQVKI